MERGREKRRAGGLMWSRTDVEGYREETGRVGGNRKTVDGRQTVMQRRDNKRGGNRNRQWGDREQMGTNIVMYRRNIASGGQAGRRAESRGKRHCMLG